MMMFDQIGTIEPAVPVEILGVPTQFIAYGDQKQILARLGLDATGIAATVRSLLA